MIKSMTAVAVVVALTAGMPRAVAFVDGFEGVDDVEVAGPGFISPATSAMTYFDGDFANWSSTYTSDASGGNATVILEPSTGNPGAALKLTTYTSGGQTAYGIAINENIVWTGPITSISMTIDTQSISGWGDGQWVCMVVEQSGVFYWANVAYTGPSTSWHTMGPKEWTEETFYEVGDSTYTEHPDFSGAGGPIKFGFAAGNTSSGTYSQRYDNWSITVIPEPMSLTVLCLGGLATFVWRGRRCRGDPT